MISIYLSGLVTAVAVFRNPNTIPFCLTTDLLLNVLFSWLLVHLPSTSFLDVLFLHDDINSIIFVCPQMVRESLSLFMFLLQVKEKEEAVEGLT